MIGSLVLRGDLKAAKYDPEVVNTGPVFVPRNRSHSGKTG